jgi:hypothetical protein
MNSLLKKAGIPQMRCKPLPGGKSPVPYCYESRLTGEAVNSNYQAEESRVEIMKVWQQVNALATAGGLRG